MSDERRRHPVPVRLSQAGMEWLDGLRLRHDVARADVIREALNVAAAHPQELEKRLKSIRERF